MPALYPQPIQSELLAQWLPRFDTELPAERFPYGARSEAAIYAGDLLYEEEPRLRAGELEIVAIARRPGVLSKVAIRAKTGAARIAGDHIARVRDRLDGERIDVVPWQRSAAAYISDALGLTEVPAVVLLPGLGHARVLLGEIDMRGIAGWRGLNTVLASALTGWRIRLEPVAGTAAWRRLEAAMRERRPVVATFVGRTARGPRVEVLGLYAVLSGVREDSPVGQESLVRVTRMDADEGRIFTSERIDSTGQLQLPLTLPGATAGRSSNTARD